MTHFPVPVYNQRIDNFTQQIKHLQSKINSIAWIRFLIVIVMVAAFWTIKPYGLLYAFAAAIVCLAAFLRLIVISLKNKEALRNLGLLLQINQQELSINSGQYTSLPDGKEFLPYTHDYANDLDIFGRASLYQYINRTTSEQGNYTLAQWLLSPAPVDDVLQRQDAARELSHQYEWRQQLQAYGQAEKIMVSTEKKITGWLEEENQFPLKKWNWIRFAGPAIMIGALGLNIAGLLASPWFYLIVFVFFVGTSLISRKVSAIYVQLDKAVKQIHTLSSILQWIEKLDVKSGLLKHTQQLCAGGSSTASTEINALTSILNRLEYRMNPLVFLPLNIFLFWDLQQVLALEKWKDKNKHHVHDWFEAVRTMEALSSIATVSFNHPEWNYPLFEQHQGVLKAMNYGHPLIAESKRVCSSFVTEGNGKIALITGSNMAGKSTFLRSTGINIVLAMMGSPVCAESFILSPVRVISSMRITDNLEESTSTFYAELKKLRYIIDNGSVVFSGVNFWNENGRLEIVMQTLSTALNKVTSFVQARINNVAGLTKPQRKFLLWLFDRWLMLPVRYNFLNLGRYGGYSEKAIRSQMSSKLPFLALFHQLFAGLSKKECVAAFDPTFIAKSGKGTYGLAKYWSGTAQQVKKGLEAGCLAIVDVKDTTAYSMEVVQTPVAAEAESLMSHYTRLITQRLADIVKYTTILTVDGYFMKEGFIKAVTGVGLKVITKARQDANMLYLYKGAQHKGPGAKKKYSGKVNWKSIDKRVFKLCYHDDDMMAYEAVVWSVALKQQLKVVYVKAGERKGYEILVCSDTEIEGEKVLRYYRLRFQIEFLIRDAKTHTGLDHCQGRSEEKLYNHFNMSMMSVSVVKYQTWARLPDKEEVSFSMRTIKTYCWNQYMTMTIFANLALDMSCSKIKRLYNQCLNIGSMAA